MIKNNLPVILLKGLVLLPHAEARVELNNDITKKVIDLSKDNYDNLVLIVALNNTLEEAPDTNDLPSCAVMAKITSRIDLPSGNSRIVLSGITRVKVLNYVNYKGDKSVLEAEVVSFPKIHYNRVEETALLRKLLEELESYISQNPYISNSILGQIRDVEDLEILTDYVANFLPLSTDKKTILMLEANRITRARKLITEINIEKAIVALENKIELDLKEDLDQMQKEMILKEKIKIIKNELGEKDSKSEYVISVNEKLESGLYPSNIVKRVKTELSRFETMLDSNPESSTIRSYIDILLSIPFGIYSEQSPSLKEVEDSLNKSHYGLNEVKERILEYVAVKLNNSRVTSPVICLVGPPGVGKTTLAISIANALNKNYSKISLGGINDPSELLGHRKTYIGSEPGRIINALIKAEQMNPVILLDEVDKMAVDYKGDPSSVLLDLLDSNQSKTFTDNYVEEKINLSDVTFILTANDRNAIPLVLQDRLDIIEINSYLETEKEKIAFDYLIKNASVSSGLKNEDVKFTKDAVLTLINDYTRESGVRELDRIINRIIRKVITDCKLNDKKISGILIDKAEVTKYLGKAKYTKRELSNRKLIGYAKGLAYTPCGGEVLEIEVTSYEGKEEFITSGHLGETLKESISIALGYIKANKHKLNIKDDAFKKTLHINFREGGIPKEGPSAGTIITSTIISYLLKKEFPLNVSSSGEITLLGDVLPVGGLREKSLAAIKNGINKIYLSRENKNDIEQMPKEIKEKVEYVFVNNYIEIYNDIFKEKSKN